VQFLFIGLQTWGRPMQVRTRIFASVMIVGLLPAAPAVAQTSSAIQQNLQRQRSFEAQMQAVPAYCQAQYARQRPSATRDQAVQMCMQQRYQSLSIALEQQKRLLEQMQKTQKQILRR